MKNIIFIISIVIFFTGALIAETSEEKGLSIAKKSYESTRGFVDSQSDQLKILIEYLKKKEITLVSYESELDEERKAVYDNQIKRGKRCLIVDSNLFLYKDKTNAKGYLRYS